MYLKNFNLKCIQLYCSGTLLALHIVEFLRSQGICPQKAVLILLIKARSVHVFRSEERVITLITRVIDERVAFSFQIWILFAGCFQLRPFGM